MREIAKTSGFAKKTYPPWIVNKMLELDEHPELEDVAPTKITDFLRIYIEVWVISSKEYQEQYWGKQGQWGDNYGETTLEFFSNVACVLEENDPPIEMTSKQRKMLQKLYDIVFEYDTDQTNPESRYGENDKAIVNDPKWKEIGKYAKLVYEELSGDDLDAWERLKNNDS